MKPNKVVEQVAVATKWSTFTEIIAKLISPVTNMVLARILTPDAFGVIATITMIVSFADMFTDAGFQKYLIQHEFKTKEEFSKSACVAFWTNFVFSILFWCVIFIFSNKIAFLVGNTGLGHVITIAALSLPLTSFSSIQMAYYKKEFKFKTLFLVRIIGVLTPIFITIPLAFFTKNYWSLIIGNLLGNIVNAILLTKYSKWKPYFYYDLKILKQMFSYSWWVLLETVSIWLTINIDIFIVGTYLSPYYLGIYKISMNTVEQLLSIIISSTLAPLFSALSRLQKNKKEFEEMYCNYMNAIGMIVIPMGVGIYLYKDFITRFFLGNQWENAVNFIGLWGLSCSVSSIFTMYSSAFYSAKGKPKFSFISQVLHLIVLIPVLIIASKYNFETLYISRCLVRLEFVLVQIVILWYYFEMSTFKIIKQLFSSIYSTFIMSLIAYLLKALFKGMIWDFISIIICILIYFINMYIFNRKDLMNNLLTLGIKINKLSR